MGLFVYLEQLPISYLFIHSTALFALIKVYAFYVDKSVTIWQSSQKSAKPRVTWPHRYMSEFSLTIFRLQYVSELNGTSLWFIITNWVCFIVRYHKKEDNFLLSSRVRMALCRVWMGISAQLMEDAVFEWDSHMPLVLGNVNKTTDWVTFYSVFFFSFWVQTTF